MTDVMEPGAAIGRDIATGDRADAQIETFISRRHAQRVKTEGERAEEEMWEVSSRLQEGRRMAEKRAAWVSYHLGQAERLRRHLGALAAQHEEQARKLLEGAAG